MPWLCWMMDLTTRLCTICSAKLLTCDFVLTMCKSSPTIGDGLSPRMPQECHQPFPCMILLSCISNVAIHQFSCCVNGSLTCGLPCWSSWLMQDLTESWLRQMICRNLHLKHPNRSCFWVDVHVFRSLCHQSWICILILRSVPKSSRRRLLWLWHQRGPMPCVPAMCPQRHQQPKWWLTNSSGSNLLLRISLDHPLMSIAHLRTIWSSCVRRCHFSAPMLLNWRRSILSQVVDFRHCPWSAAVTGLSHDTAVWMAFGPWLGFRWSGWRRNPFRSEARCFGRPSQRCYQLPSVLHFPGQALWD